MTTRAKFMCNGINLRMGSATNPAYADLVEEVDRDPEVSDQDAVKEVARRAQEREIPQWISCQLPTVLLNPVYAPDDSNHENHKFWTASPSGEMTLTIANPAGAEVFELGEMYYVDFTKAPR